MKYGCVVRTRLNGTRIYGPYEADHAIAEFQRWDAKITQITHEGYGGRPLDPDDPQEVELATFGLTSDEEKRADAKALLRCEVCGKEGYCGTHNDQNIDNEE